MAEDFSKIFAQGATSKQSWTDSNYNTGWGYLGQEPPPYELFDYLFNRLDKKDKELHDKFTTFNSTWLGYIPVKRINDTTIQIMKGDGSTENITINNVSHASSASTAITASSTDKSTNIANTSWVYSRIAESIKTLGDKTVTSVTGSNDTLTVTKGDGSSSEITINNVEHASNADEATKANFLATNENGAIYHDLSKVAAGANVNLRVNWSAKDNTRKIMRYIFHDAKGTGDLADLQAKTVYADVNGNATSANKASTVAFTRGNEIVLDGTPSKSDEAWLGFRSEGYSGQPLKKWKMGDLTATGGLAAVEAKEFIGPATVLKGIYTQNGGRQPPRYFGRNSVGALMSNEPVNGDTSYKDWLYLDTYPADDAGGPTAIGLSRASTKAFIMRADSDRGAWRDSAELLTTKGGHTVAGNMVFNGTVTTKNGIIVPTRSRGDNTTYAASTEFVQDAISALINGSPAALDTLKELADALGNDANFASTITKQLGLKAPLASPSFTGTVTGPTPALEANNTQFATTAWVLQSIAANATGPIVGDVSNSDGWWVKIPCVGFNLLIQGGFVLYRRNQKIKFPVAFNSRCLSVVAFDKSDFGDDINWIYGTGSYTTTDFFCLAERIDGTYPDDCSCQYIAIGV